jgi:hypothetical protein
MIRVGPDADFSDAYIEGDDTARWRSAPGHAPSQGSKASGSSIVEVPGGMPAPGPASASATR